MHNKILNFLKAAIISIIVAFLFTGIVCMIYNQLVKEKFEAVASILQMISVKDVENKPVELVLKNNKLEGTPPINSEYATLIIDKIDVELPIYYGDSLEVLKKGIGHHLTTYLPGEGGSIVCMGHNYKKYLQRLPEVEKGDKIVVKTEYGTFEYTVYDTKIVGETEVSAVPVQDEEEIFMLYTCYPTYGLGHATQRLIVYAK